MIDLADTLARRPVILDGGLGTLLEARGNDVTSELWSARVLRDDPDEVRALASLTRKLLVGLEADEAAAVRWA